MGGQAWRGKGGKSGNGIRASHGPAMEAAVEVQFAASCADSVVPVQSAFSFIRPCLLARSNGGGMSLNPHRQASQAVTGLILVGVRCIPRY